MQIDPWMREGLVHHQAGRLAQAEAIYRELLRQDPQHAWATHFLGLIADQTGQPQTAVELMLRSIELDPTAADFHNNLSVAYQNLGRSAEGVASARRALGLRADFVPALINLANGLSTLGQLSEAIEFYRRATQLDPQQASAHQGMGLALRSMGRMPEAEQSLRAVVRLRPDAPEAHNNLAATLCAMGKTAEGIAEFRAATARAPGRAGFHANLAHACNDAGLSDEALDVARKSVSLDPACREAQTELAKVLLQRGEIDSAIEHFRRAATLFPQDETVASNLLFALMNDPNTTPAQLLEEHIAWGRRHVSGNSAASALWYDRSPDRPLRIGYVSPDFRSHSVGQFFAPILLGHSRGEFRVYCYASVLHPDEFTTQLRAAAQAGWRDIVSLPDDAVRKLIVADQIDILVDLAVHSGGSRLTVLAHGAAPVQVTYLGYPGTTGLPGVDYKLTDPHIDPPGMSESYHTERLVYLQHSYFCYPAPVRSPDVTEPPALRRGYVTFGSFNSLAKVNPLVLRLWARLLASVPDSRIVLSTGARESPRLEERIHRMFATNGVDRARVEFLPRLDLRPYLEKHGDLDILLDPFPFSGGTTTCHGLWMGVPLVTLAYRHGVSRMGTSFLANLGLNDLIATSEDDYVAIAARLASDPDRMRQLRATLRDRMRSSALMDAGAFVRDLEGLYRQMWTRFCQSP